MKNFAAKLFLIVIALTALSAAAVAKTTGSDNMIDYFATASGGENTNSAFREPTNNDLINSFLGRPVCWLVWKFPDGQEIPVRVPCSKKGK